MTTTGQGPQTHLDQVAEGDPCGEHQVEMKEQLQQSGKDRTHLHVLLKLQNKKVYLVTVLLTPAAVIPLYAHSSHAPLLTFEHSCLNP